MRKVRGKINRDGVLETERAGEFKEMECRKSTSSINSGYLCGDDCSLFGEPEELTDGTTALMLCETLWQFAEFEDER